MGKYIKIILSCLVVLAMTVSCSKTEKRNNINITGEWHLTDASITDISGIDVYVSFTAERTFTLYQKLGEGRFVRFTGTYSVSGNIIDGHYSDRTAWACSYKASVDSGTLVFVAQSSSGETTKYEKEQIPEEIIAEAIDNKSSQIDFSGGKFL